MMLEVTVKKDRLYFGDDFGLSFLRTLRIPDDGNTYPLPPGLTPFPIHRVADYGDRVPGHWAKNGGFFLPMYQREAMWINFHDRYWKPNALKIAVGRVNAVSGKPWVKELGEGEEDYLVCPPQPWLDGINAGDGYIRQFVAMPLGMGYTVEAQVSGEEKFGGVQIFVYEPQPGIFPDEPPLRPVTGTRSMEFLAIAESAPMAKGDEMGLAAGGKMKQQIYPDPHGLDTWDQENYGRAEIHIVNSMMYREITGKEPPPTPISAKTYTRYGFPWFDLYDDALPDIAPPEALQGVKTVKQKDAELGFEAQQDDSSIAVPEKQIKKYDMDDLKGKGNIK